MCFSVFDSLSEKVEFNRFPSVDLPRLPKQPRSPDQKRRFHRNFLQNKRENTMMLFTKGLDLDR